MEPNIYFCLNIYILFMIITNNLEYFRYYKIKILLFAALKHYTSKIREFNDLETVCTLGFRGEALSSLCALSNITVTTKDDTAAHATKIEYDHNGVIKVKVPTARSRGTTVSLVNIFATLPVRRKEFIKNLKREFNKMCQLLYAYCLVCKGIK